MIVKNMESSASYQSTTDQTSNENSLSSYVRNYGLFFQLYDTLFQNITIPYIFDLIMFLFVGFQVIYTGIFEPRSEYLHTSHFSNIFMKYFRAILNFMPLDLNDQNLLYTFIAYLVIFILSFGHFILQILIMKFRGRLIKGTLYTTKLFIMSVPFLMMHPTAILTGRCFNRLLEPDHPSYMPIIFVFSGIFMFYFTIFFYISYRFLGCSVYLPYSPLASFNIRPTVRTAISSACCQLAANITPSFPQWSLYFVMVVYLAFLIHGFVANLKGNLVMKIANVLLLSMYIELILFIIFRAIFIFLPNLTGDNAIFFYVAIFIISNILAALYFHFTSKFFIKKLDQLIEEEGLESIKKEEGRARLYQNMGMDKGESRSLMFLDFVIQHHYHMFIDLITIKYIITQYHSTDIILHCLRMIAFFPCLTSYINVLFPELSKRHDLSIFSKFLLYEIQRIKIQRQSSSSAAAADSLKILSQRGRELEANIHFFWTQTSARPQSLCGLTSSINKLQILWEEEISHFQNSIQHYTDYERFLIECKTDFTGSVYQHYKRGMIESGTSFKVDKCFEMFIRLFPEYLKKGLMNVSGRFIVKNDKDKRGSSSQGNSNSVNISSSSSELDAALEQNLGKSMFGQTRLRIALQHATENKNAESALKIYIAAGFLVLVSMIFSLVLYFYYRNSLDDRGKTTIRIGYVMSMRFYSLMGTIAFIIDHGAYSIYNNNKYIVFNDDYDDEELFLPSFYTFNSSFVEMSRELIVKTRYFYDEFMSDIVEVSKTQGNIFEYTPQLFDKEAIKIPQCKEFEIFEWDDNFEAIYKSISGFESYDFKQGFLYYLVSQSILTTREQNTQIFYFCLSTSLCTVVNTTSVLPDVFNGLTESMAKSMKTVTNNVEKSIKIVKWVIPIVFFVYLTVIIIYIFYLYFVEIKKFLNLLLNLPTEVKKVANEQIFRLGDHTELSISECSSNSAVIVAPLVAVIAILFGLASLMFVELLEFENDNRLYGYISNWITNSRARKSCTAEMAFWVIFSVFSTTDFYDTFDKQFNFLFLENATAAYIHAWDELRERTALIMSENEDSPVPLGFSQNIDDLLLRQFCEVSNESSFHELYRCASSQQLLSVFGTAVKDVMKDIKGLNGVIGGPIIGDFKHILGDHIIPLMMAIDDAFSQLSKDVRSNLYYIFDIIIAVQFVLILFLIIMLLLLINRFNSIYKVAMMIMRRVPPHAIIADNSLMYYLLNKKASKDNSEMSTGQRIVHGSKDAILCLDHKGIIDIINPSVSSLFGYTPEQLLGQSITTLISLQDKTDVENQLVLMKNRQSAATFEGHINCITDDESAMMCQITILAMVNEKGSIDSFVVILRDESALQQQQRSAEEAKKQSENLLYQILPRDIVVRLNQGEKDISFSVPSATIMFVDIVKFSEYSSSLSPQEIMCNLSLIFNSFDTAITKYNLLIKIKLIGDVYMCAGGLFTPDEPPNTHAIQMANFAIEVLQLLEDVNMKLNSVLNVRIGINTGGPLIAGVLGSDKPVFDIIGDPINVASRLQSTDIPGNAQISQSTYDLICNNDFQIEPRGEIMLKGKGKTMTYMLYPLKTALLTSESSLSRVDSSFASISNIVTIPTT